MAQLLIPQPPDLELPVFFNVDGVVGAQPAQNLTEDVLLVQFFLSQIARTPRATTPPELVAACKAVIPSNGTIDDATIRAIRVFQQEMKKQSPVQIVDARVSPSRGSTTFGAALFTIVVLNKAVRTRILDIWPRIDKIEKCPLDLKKMVGRELVGVSNNAQQK